MILRRLKAYIIDLKADDTVELFFFLNFLKFDVFTATSNGFLGQNSIIFSFY